MRKYIRIAAVSFKSQIVWRFDTLMTLALGLFQVLMNYVLWGAIFSEREGVAGFTQGTMMAYAVASAMLSRLDLSASVSAEVSARLRDGTFSRYMVLPVGPQTYFLFQTAGAAGYMLLFAAPAAALFSLLFGAAWPPLPGAGTLLAAALMTLLGLAFMAELHFLLGVLVLRFENISVFLMIQNNLTLFLTGAMVPLMLLPAGLRAAMRLFPFYYVTYLPAMLLTGRCAGEALPGLAVISLWLALTAALGAGLYRRLRLRYDGVGL